MRLRMTVCVSVNVMDCVEVASRTAVSVVSCVVVAVDVMVRKMVSCSG